MELLNRKRRSNMATSKERQIARDNKLEEMLKKIEVIDKLVRALAKKAKLEVPSTEDEPEAKS